MCATVDVYICTVGNLQLQNVASCETTVKEESESQMSFYYL